jgi:hypothetical protein
MSSTPRYSSHRLISRIAHSTGRRLLLLAVLAPSAAVLALVPAPALAQDPGFTCADRSGGAAGEVQAALTSVRFAHHDGYDRLVFGFANAPAVPAYTLVRQASAVFGTSPRVGTRTLDGSAGLLTIFQGTLWTDGVPLSDARPALPVIREVAALQNFEGVTAYGVGLSRPACFRTMELSGPSRLVIDFATPNDQPAAGAGSTQPTSAQAASPAALAQTGLSASGRAGYELPLAATGAVLLLAGLTLVWTRRRLVRR